MQGRAAGPVRRGRQARKDPVAILGAVVAVTAEDDRFRVVRERAAELALAEGRPLVVYDWDAPSLFAAPLPTWWSGDGPGERPRGALDEHELDTAGRTPIADQVRSLKAHGIVAAGWLPADGGAEALARLALEEGAAALVVPADIVDAAGLVRPETAATTQPDATSPSVALRVISVPAEPD